MFSYKVLIHSYNLTKSRAHDIAYLFEVKQQFDNCLILGEKGYSSAEINLDLFNSAKNHLESSMLVKKKEYKPQSYLFKNARKLIETIYSQFCANLEL